MFGRWLVAFSALLVGCQQPCGEGFTAGADGNCYESPAVEEESFWASHGEFLGDITLNHVPSGAWTMGLDESDEDWDSSHLSHEVELTGEVWISTYEISVRQWIEYMGYNPSEIWLGEMWAQEELDDAEHKPVHSVTYDEILAFANAMSAHHGLQECFSCEGEGTEVSCSITVSPYVCEGYRMVTEAEWEWAAMGGEGFKYPGSDEINDIGWWEENSEMDTHANGTKIPNGYGLYDMGGNIREFVLDWFDMYDQQPKVDPFVFPEDGEWPAERGGSFACRSPELRVNRRNMKGDYDRDMHSGFRIARTVTEQ